MKKLSKHLKVFSLIMALVFVFSFAAFALPEDNSSVTPEPPEIEENTTQPNDEPETQPAENTEPPIETTTPPAVSQTTTTTTTTNAAVKTTHTAALSTTSREKSSNADLGTLEVSGVTSEGEIIKLVLSPDFNADVKVYNIEIPKNVISLKINAKAVSAKANVKIPDDLTIKEENNIYKIVVTAEDDTTKTYEIALKVVQEEITEIETEPSTIPSVTVNVKPDYSEKGMNTYTKLGIVFAVGGAALLGISIYLFFKKKK